MEPKEERVGRRPSAKGKAELNLANTVSQEWVGSGQREKDGKSCQGENIWANLAGWGEATE